MTQENHDLRIRHLQELSTPAEVMEEVPASPHALATAQDGRAAIHQILWGLDDRLLVVVGPCSIHDPEAAIGYARRLSALRARFAGELEIVMRVYFEKPRTTVGWKGLINDPKLDGSCDINAGLRLGRRLLADVNALGLPAGTEFLDTTTPQYIADLVSWGAIGARTTESQIHRELASGLSCPIGFKNGTSGDVKIAVDAVTSAGNPHHFLAVTSEGKAAIAATRGNHDGHIILRGGGGTNYDAASVQAACMKLEQAGLRPMVMVDASHANAGKKAENQPKVTADLASQIADGEDRIVGVMIESNLVAGRQEIGPNMTYGQSVTDECIGWDSTAKVLEDLAAAVDIRRAGLPKTAARPVLREVS